MTKIEADIARLEAKANAMAHLRDLIADAVNDMDACINDLKDRLGISRQGMLEVEKGDTPARE